MKHLFKNKPVNITWEQGQMMENHGNGCGYFHLTGEDDSGIEYIAYGCYQQDDLIEVFEIELAPNK